LVSAAARGPFDQGWDARQLRFIDGYNERCQPFRWAKTADQILAKAQRNPSA
jgi:hypothetical protein